MRLSPQTIAQQKEMMELVIKNATTGTVDGMEKIARRSQPMDTCHLLNRDTNKQFANYEWYFLSLRKVKLAGTGYGLFHILYFNFVMVDTTKILLHLCNCI